MLGSKVLAPRPKGMLNVPRNMLIKQLRVTYQIQHLLILGGVPFVQITPGCPQAVQVDSRDFCLCQKERALACFGRHLAKRQPTSKGKVKATRTAEDPTQDIWARKWLIVMLPIIFTSIGFTPRYAL